MSWYSWLGFISLMYWITVAHLHWSCVLDHMILFTLFRFTLQSLAFETVQPAGPVNYNKRCQLWKIQQLPLRSNGLATLAKLKHIIARILLLWRVERNISRKFSRNGIGRLWLSDYNYSHVLVFNLYFPVKNVQLNIQSYDMTVYRRRGWDSSNGAVLKNPCLVYRKTMLLLLMT